MWCMFFLPSTCKVFLKKLALISILYSKYKYLLVLLCCNMRKHNCLLHYVFSQDKMDKYKQVKDERPKFNKHHHTITNN